MSHTRNTNVWAKPQDPAALDQAPSTEIYKLHEAWATLHGYRTKAQASSAKLDKSSGLGYHRINGEVEHLERSVARTHITNRRNAHFVRSSMRAARQDPGLPVDSNVLMVMERPGDRDPEQQATSHKHEMQAPSFKPQALTIQKSQAN